MADKVVQLVDKNSNNLYPVAGAAITNAISTGAISSQAVTSAKIANGNVTGVANNATVVGNTQLALDTVGTPNLRNQSVTSDKIDWTTINSLDIPPNQITTGLGTILYSQQGNILKIYYTAGETAIVIPSGVTQLAVLPNSVKPATPNARATLIGEKVTGKVCLEYVDGNSRKVRLWNFTNSSISVSGTGADMAIGYLVS